MSDDNTRIRQLIKRAKRGDSEAVSTIYQLHVDMIYRYVAYRVGSEVDAEDLTAEVFVKMVEGLPRYKDTGAPFEAWLYRIASARVADFYRYRGRRPVEELSETIAEGSPLPEERLLTQQETSELRSALGQLGEDEQRVLILRFVERRSHQEVAIILDKSVSAVKSIQHRALVRLAALMGSEEKPRHYLRGQHD